MLPVRAQIDSLLFFYIILFTLAIFIADLYPIRLPTADNAEVTVSCVFKTAAAIVYGPVVAVPATFLGTLLAEMAMHRDWHKAIFNVGEMTLTASAMSLVYEVFHTGGRMPFASIRNAAAVMGMVSSYALLNTGLVGAIMSLAGGAPFWRVWRSNFKESVWNNLTIIPMGAVVATLWIYNFWSVLFLVLPLVVVRRSFQFIGELQIQTRETLVRMADAIDRRDPSTFQHSQRVAFYAEAIAKGMGVSSDEAETIRMAGRLHDLGKIGMSNGLLFKPGRFDEAEMAEFQRHPVISAELVKSFRLFREGQSLILHHHERYDGTGYPDRLKSGEVPFGSRVLAVADAFDAMTSRREYRSPLSTEQAIAELVRCRGTQFDPLVADVFIQMLHGDELRSTLDSLIYSSQPAV